MDVVKSIRSCLADWEKGGESECRNILISPHCNPNNSSCLDVLTTAYHTLLSSTLLTWSPKHLLTVDAFVAFVQSVLDSLPSSSSNPSSNMALFGELLVDLIWSIDAELEEVVIDAKAIITSYGDSKGKDIKDTPSKDRSSLLTKAMKAKQNVENDKDAVTLVVKKFLMTGIINPALCRERLDLALLAGVGLILDRASFDKREIRTRTGLFYKQNKFNLLREQSEGYSKLTAELTSSLGPAHSSASARPIESYDSIEARARPVWERVISLIGYFDLDPNRALDMILDVLSVHLATHFSFFIALLSFSPWSGSYRKPTMTKVTVEPPLGQYRGKSLDETLLLAESHSVQGHNGSSLMLSSPRVLAQVLGFKFAYYQSPEVGEVTPKNLYLTAAILIREGFISLEDLYPHVSPNDNDMEKVRKNYQADVQSRILGAKTSQLAMAAPLESSTSSVKSKPVIPSELKKPAEPKEKEVPNQKVGLLTALLSVGALRPAFGIMSKFPWLVDVQPEIADLMLRVMKESLSGLYESTLVTKERNPSFILPRARYGMGGVSLPPPRKPVLTLWAPTPPSTSTTDFVFFFPDWTERVPVCSSLDDLVDVVEPMMRFIGLHVSRDPLFLTKFLRLGRLHLTSTIPFDPETKKYVGEPDPDHPVRKFWFMILRLYLLPALTLIRGNAVCAVEVWNIIRQYETTARWSLYGEWKSTIYKSHPELCIREVQADRESKGILRRLSHNTIDTLSGTVAKLAHSNPCIFFTNAVNQIMAYDNLANVVIQALRYVTNMGFDVLVFIVLDALANPTKPRVKDDGVNTSDWLQSLASFTGMLFRRYSADLSPVLKYVVHQLHNGQTTEIVVLRELIWKMAGIEPLPSLSESQITAMAGGPALRIEAVASGTRGARLDPGDVALKGPQRLGKGLLESSLALPLLIQVAQQRQACVFNAPDAHLKSLASLYDTTHGVLLQYLELLTSPSVVSPQDYATKILPSLAELAEQYGICAPICMQIIRPVLHNTLLAAALSMQEQERIANEEAEKRLKAALTAKREPANVSRMASPSVGSSGTPNETTMVASDAVVETKPTSLENNVSEDIVMEDTGASVASPPLAESPWLPELAALFDDIKLVAPSNAFDVIGPGFYVTFWQLSTYDLTPPASKYDEEGAALRTLSRQEDSKYIAADRSADRTKRLTASSHRTRRDRYNVYVNTLAQEFKEQTVSRAFTMKRLAREKLHWFSHTPKGTALASAIIEHCIQPRCLLSPMDADFCAQIIKVIHTQGTPGFPTLMCYNKLLGDHVKVVMFSCSEYEARNYGRFLFGILTDLLKWQQDEQLFIQDNRTKVGGKTILHPGLLVRWQNKPTIVTEDLIKWADYKLLIRKWHRRLGKCFTDCIQTGEFMHVYNAIIVLKEILPVFPLASVGDVGSSLDVTIHEFLETEERGDLKILGRAYAASLKKREALWAMPKSAKPNGAAASPRPTSPATGDRIRSTGIPSGPGSQISTGDRRPPTVSTPSAPRSHTGPHNATQPAADKSSTGVSSTKLAMESIPRPEVVKRIRPETKNSESPKPTIDGKATKSEADIDTSTMTERNQESTLSRVDEFRFLQKEGNSTTGRINTLGTSRTNSPVIGPDSSSAGRKDSSQSKDPSRPPTPSQTTTSTPFNTHGKELLQSPRNHRSLEDKVPRAEHVMPPPSVPSQTLSAQELRETAKQTITLRPTERLDERTARSTNETWSQNGSAVPHRSSSPPSRPGTRNASAESRTSGGRPRSDRESGDGDRTEDKRLERENRQDLRDYGPSMGRRESLTHSRGVRERPSAREGDREKDVKDGERDRERERERGRDRHGDRTDRDRERGDRDRDRDRGERDRDNRERDRHRRDDKDRERDGRKDRDANRVASVNSTSAIPDERGLPTRPDLSRHRSVQNGDDSLGKRRRPTDDDPDSRVSKRSSRKDSHREDRSRRASDKESHDRTRDSDRRRKDRDGENPSVEKSGDKRIPEGPLSSTKVLPSSTPSAPRAMSTTSEVSRGGKADIATGRDREWKGQRDQPSSFSQAGPSGGSSTSQQEPLSHPGSLRSRIGDKDILSRSLPQVPHNSYRPDPSNKDDDRDSSRKRTLSDREKDIAEPASGAGPEQAAQVPKRPRINRNRYAIAQKLLPIDPQVGDRKRSGRSD